MTDAAAETAVVVEGARKPFVGLQGADALCSMGAGRADISRA